MIYVALISLALGIYWGISDPNHWVLTELVVNQEYILYFLMFSAGISIGMHKGLLKGLKKHRKAIVWIPFGTITGSLFGGFLAGLIRHFPMKDALAIAGGLSWYSLTGIAVENISGPSMGMIAFISNLIRELFAFVGIPFLAKHLHYYTCIAAAGAASEDTTLPIMIQHTDAKTAVISVIHGVICSAFVPVLISFAYRFPIS